MTTSSTITPTPVLADKALKPKLRLAYLSTQYPAVSHTFIRRELHELERRGHDIVRLSIRPPQVDLVDPLDRTEARRTISCLSQSVWRLLSATARLAVTRPLRFLQALQLSMAMGRRSERGMLRHFAYLMEASFVSAFCARENIRHVHVHFGTNAATVARLTYRLGGPTYSLTVHGPDEFDAPVGFDLAGKIADAQFVAAISDYCRAQLYRWSATEHWSKIHVIRCTVDGHYNAVPVAPVPKESITLLNIGRLNAQKGQLLLLDALHQLRREGIPVHLVIIGDGELRQLLKQRLVRLGLIDCVEITGYLSEEEVIRHLRKARTLVLSSFAEGLPVVIMEALAAGRPVISTAIAGVPELVRDGVNGWLIPAGDVQALTGAMRAALLANPAELDAMGAIGRRHVLAQHSAAGQVDVLERLLRQTAAGGMDRGN